METFIAIVIMFGLIISIHELGHLILAKRVGILCREFAIGFGPKLFSFRKHETIYTVRLLPIGGFVRMAGEDPEVVDVKPGHRVGLVFNNDDEVSKIIINHKSKHPEARVITVEEVDLEKDLYLKGYENDEGEPVTFRVNERADLIVDERPVQIAPLDRQFPGKSIGSRFLAIFAGPFMNFILAFMLLVVFAAIQGIPTGEAQLGKLIPGDPAERAGLEQGDKVLAIGGHPVHSWDQFTSIIQKNPDHSLIFKINRNGHILEIPVTPEKRQTDQRTSMGQIGTYAPMEHSVIGSLRFGLANTARYSTLIFDAVGKLVTGQIGINSLSGPVGIYSYTGQVAQQGGVIALLSFAAFLSVNIGIFNLLPLPALDGGRLIFLLFEAVRGKPMDPKKESLVHFVGFALLFLLMIVVTWNDIQRFFLN